ncbi:hypothetical protein SVAN01_05358 [Stagonosporopsis vannaccii]|nr:hypothetical protein SVAN01_05358 [Stagonosporopsis vannaccii]
MPMQPASPMPSFETGSPGLHRARKRPLTLRNYAPAIKHNNHGRVALHSVSRSRASREGGLVSARVYLIRVSYVAERDLTAKLYVVACLEAWGRDSDARVSGAPELVRKDAARVATDFHGASLGTWHCETPYLGLVSFDVHACRRSLQCVVSRRERGWGARMYGQQEQTFKACLDIPLLLSSELHRQIFNGDGISMCRGPETFSLDSRPRSAR